MHLRFANRRSQGRNLLISEPPDDPVWSRTPAAGRVPCGAPAGCSGAHLWKAIPVIRDIMLRVRRRLGSSPLDRSEGVSNFQLTSIYFPRKIWLTNWESHPATYMWWLSSKHLVPLNQDLLVLIELLYRLRWAIGVKARQLSWKEKEASYWSRLIQHYAEDVVAAITRYTGLQHFSIVTEVPYPTFFMLLQVNNSLTRRRFDDNFYIHRIAIDITLTKPSWWSGTIKLEWNHSSGSVSYQILSCCRELTSKQGL